MKLDYVSPDIEFLLLETILTSGDSPNQGGDEGGWGDNETPGTGDDWS